MEKAKKSLTFLLTELLYLSKNSEQTAIKDILKILSGRGNAALVIILSLPFCLPIQIPGFSTPFGLLLIFLGLQIAFGKKMWLPKTILEKKIQKEQIESLVQKTTKALNFLQKFIHPRLIFFTQNPWIHHLNGLIISFLGVLLALPLPIPLSNILIAVPLVCIGLGLLEDDGLFVLIGYALSFFGVGVLVAAIFFSYTHIQTYIS